MNRKEIKKKRWLKSMGRKKVERIYIKRVKHNEILLPLTNYSWWERFWSLWPRTRFGGETAN